MAKEEINIEDLKRFLVGLYRRYNSRKYISHDPLRFACRYERREDAEIAALLAAVLAYGRVGQISNSLEKLFAITGDSPYDFTMNFGQAEEAKLVDFRHRFNSGGDMADLFRVLKVALKDKGSLEDIFVESYRPADTNTVGALTGFVHSLLNIHSQETGCEPSAGLKYLLSDPKKNSPCKRLHLFLRWVVRDDAVDLGLWKKVSKADLLIPMDVHMSRITGVLNFHDHKSISIRTAVLATAGFAEICPEDPVKYDFVLCRIGMLGGGQDWKSIKSYIQGNNE